MARGQADTCGICGEQVVYGSWVQGQRVCTGICYATAVAKALAAVRTLRRTPVEPARPFDRSPMPMTPENVRALERDARARSWAMRSRRPAHRGHRLCGQCNTTIRRERDALHVPCLGVFCSLTCATIANGGVIPDV